MSAAFTPGPWHYGDEDESIVGVHYVDVHAGEPSYRCTASVEGPFVEGEFCSLDDETRANARLIAAAPELFEAVRLFVEKYDAADHDDGVALMLAYNAALVAGQSALAKARGQ